MQVNFKKSYSSDEFDDNAFTPSAEITLNIIKSEVTIEIFESVQQHVATLEEFVRSAQTANEAHAKHELVICSEGEDAIPTLKNEVEELMITVEALHEDKKNAGEAEENNEHQNAKADALASSTTSVLKKSSTEHECMDEIITISLKTTLDKLNSNVPTVTAEVFETLLQQIAPLKENVNSAPAESGPLASNEKQEEPEAMHCSFAIKR